MKIKTRLKLNTWLSLGLVVFMLISLTWSFWEEDRIEQNVFLVDNLEKAAFERAILRDDWLLNREDRAKTQWYAKTVTIRTLLEEASRKFASPESKALLQDAREDFEATSLLFSIILDKYAREGVATARKLDFTEAESRRLSQVFLKAYSLNDNISRLHDYYRKAAITARHRVIIFMMVFIVGGIMALVFNSIMVNKIVARRVTELSEGLAEISGGNLDHQIVVQGDDELADLARAGNDMVVKLKQSYTSVENLEREVAGRKQAQENVQKLSLRQQALITAIPDIIMEVDENKIYTWANAAGCEFFGEDVLGKEAAAYFIREQSTYDVVGPVFNGNEDVIYVESWQKRKDGQERLLAWWCRVLKDTQGNVTGALSSTRDITDRNLSEEKLRESEDKFKYMFENSNVGKSITYPDGKVNVNRAFSEIIGYSQDEINERGWRDITHPDDIALTYAMMENILSGKKDSVRFIKRFIHANGSAVWTDVASSLRRDKDGMPLYFMTTLIDITEQKLAQFQREAALAEVTRVSRLFAFLSQINQLIIRTRQRDELFAEACGIAIDYGKFRMAWIGLVDEHEQAVLPLAWDGFEEGYLSIIKKISISDIPEGRGPTGTAIREKKHFFCNDIANDLCMESWREEALKRGYASSIALPVILQDSVIAAFNIYSSEPFYFNEAEILLLGEVAGNVSYALEMMEIEKRRKQAEEEIQRINEDLEQRVASRTAELTAKTTDLERINKVFVDRELRMRELKARIAELERREASLVKREA